MRWSASVVRLSDVAYIGSNSKTNYYYYYYYYYYNKCHGLECCHHIVYKNLNLNCCTVQCRRLLTIGVDGATSAVWLMKKAKLRLTSGMSKVRSRPESLVADCSMHALQPPSLVCILLPLHGNEEDITGFPLFYWQKIQDFSRTPWKIFQDLFGAGECLNIKKKTAFTYIYLLTYAKGVKMHQHSTLYLSKQ